MKNFEMTTTTATATVNYTFKSDDRRFLLIEITAPDGIYGFGVKVIWERDGWREGFKEAYREARKNVKRNRKRFQKDPIEYAHVHTFTGLPF